MTDFGFWRGKKGRFLLDDDLCMSGTSARERIRAILTILSRTTVMLGCLLRRVSTFFAMIWRVARSSPSPPHRIEEPGLGSSACIANV